MRLMFAWSMLLSCVAGLASYPQGPLIKVEQTWSGPEIALPKKPPKFKPERSPNCCACKVDAATSRTSVRRTKYGIRVLIR